MIYNMPWVCVGHDRAWGVMWRKRLEIHGFQPNSISLVELWASWGMFFCTVIPPRRIISARRKKGAITLPRFLPEADKMYLDLLSASALDFNIATWLHSWDICESWVLLPTLFLVNTGFTDLLAFTTSLYLVYVHLGCNASMGMSLPGSPRERNT